MDLLHRTFHGVCFVGRGVVVSDGRCEMRSESPFTETIQNDIMRALRVNGDQTAMQLAARFPHLGKSAYHTVLYHLKKLEKAGFVANTTPARKRNVYWGRVPR